MKTSVFINMVDINIIIIILLFVIYIRTRPQMALAKFCENNRGLLPTHKMKKKKNVLSVLCIHTILFKTE